MDAKTFEAMVEVRVELRRAEKLFPDWPTDAFHALAILTEEVGELAQTLLKSAYENGPAPSRHGAVQVAAMAVRLLANWDSYDQVIAAKGGE